MSTIRVSKTRDYSVVSNYAANDKSLSWKAKGILYYLLTKPDSWTVNRDNLVHMATDGETSVRSALCELESHGYLRRTRKQLPNGRFEWESVLYEVPSKTEPSGQKPSGGFPPLDKTPLVNTDEEKTYSVFIEEPLQSEVEVPTSTVTSPMSSKPTVNDKPTVRESPKVQRTTVKSLATIDELKPYYAAYRLGLNGTPCTEPVTDSQVKRYARAFQEMFDANYSLESITNVTAKIKKSWDSNAQGKTYTVSPDSVLEHWDRYFVPAKTPTAPRSAPPPPSPTITEVDDTPYTEEQRLALRKSMWEAMWVERKHAASNGYFPDYQERIAYNALTDAQKAQSRAQGYVEGFCPVFEEYLAEI